MSAPRDRREEGHFVAFVQGLVGVAQGLVQGHAQATGLIQRGGMSGGLTGQPALQLAHCTGRIATILFAHRLGTALEPECKMYRFAADIFNDTAMVLDCLSPGFPKPLRVVVLSGASCLRALCGVCAGSAKASLSAHFAKAGNLGEVNAVSL